MVSTNFIIKAVVVRPLLYRGKYLDTKLEINISI